MRNRLREFMDAPTAASRETPPDGFEWRWYQNHRFACCLTCGAFTDKSHATKHRSWHDDAHH